jgi:single-stranded-DNA-specific exonuclease
MAEMQSFPPLIAQLLHNRGIANLAEAELFLNPDKRLSGNPFLLPDMEMAVARVRRALLQGEKMAIYGDFDCDGICGTAILVRGISVLGGNVTPYIPRRVEEGRGLGELGLNELHQRGVTLVITVDCGVDSVDEVEYARAREMDVLITDHHMPMSSLPAAVAVVNPRRADSAYSHSQLAGVGVAFKLLQALWSTLDREEHELESFLDLVCLGTVADMVPLVGENRYLVKRGLEVLNSTDRIGLRELIEVTGLCFGSLDAGDVSWVLGPCLNASGRMAYAITGYRLLVIDSSEEAHDLALELHRQNTERKQLTEDVLARAREQVLATGLDVPLLMVGGEDYPQGVIGLVAGRLVDEFHRPSIVFQRGLEISQGSARSISEFDVISALAGCRHILSQFGGHPMAAGFILPTADVERLHQCLLQIAGQRLAHVDFSPSISIDAEVQLSSVGRAFKMMSNFAPFGVGNQIPTLLSRDVRVVESHTVGDGGKHLKLKLRDGNITWHGIGFGMGERIAQLSHRLDIVYQMSVNQWRGEKLLELEVLDFAPSAGVDPAA